MTGRSRAVLESPRPASTVVRSAAALVCLCLWLALGALPALGEESGFLSLPSFTARATTGGVVFAFDAPDYGAASVELALPREKGKPRTVEHHRQLRRGSNRLDFSTDGAAGPVDYSLELSFPGYAFESELGRFGRGEGQFFKPTHVAVGPRGEAYVVDTGNDRIQVFDRHLNFIFQFGSFNPGPASAQSEVENARFDEPWDVVIGGNQELYVTDQRNDRVVRLDLMGRYISEFGRDDGLAVPRGIACDVDRLLYVCDSDNDRVLVFDRDGRLRKRLGAYGWGPRQFKGPSDVAVSREGRLYVADAGNRRIQVFDRFERAEGFIEGPFQTPENLYLDPDGFLFVIDSAAGRIFRYAEDRALVGTFPGPGDRYELKGPTDCARAPDGALLVVDSGNGRLLVLAEKRRAFRRSGTLQVPAAPARPSPSSR